VEVAVDFVVRRVASPLVVAHDRNLRARTALHAPNALRLISANLIKQVISKDRLVGSENLLFRLVLHVSEVRVVLQFESFALVKSAEGVASSHLVIFSQTHSAVGNNVAVVLNS